MVLAESIEKFVGNTSLFDFANGIYAKMEFMNPSGSIKDRMVKYMIEDAESKGIIKRGSVIAEATSGNTGISLATISAARGYKARIFMPHYMSEERKAIMRLYGAELILTKDMNEAKKLAEKEREKGIFLLDQFRNKANIKAHYETTGKEIIRQMEGKNIDAFVAGIGTGGTLIGVGNALREKYKKIYIAAVLPKEKNNEIEGIGNYYQKEIVDEKMIDEIIRISNKDAIEMQKKLIKKYGLFVGISSGANCLAANMLKEKGFRTVVTLLPDSADRYINKLAKNAEEGI